MEASSVSVIITETDGNISYRYRDVVGKNTRILKSGNHSKTFYKNLWVGLDDNLRNRLYKVLFVNGNGCWEDRNPQSVFVHDLLF